MSNRARDQRAFCIKRPDGALLITTMERSNSRCWQQFVYHSGTPVSRREYESHGYQCVKTSIAEYATESPKPEQAYIPPPEPEYLIQGAIILTDEHTIVKLPKSVRMNDCYIMNRKDYSNDRYIPQAVIKQVVEENNFKYSQATDGNYRESQMLVREADLDKLNAAIEALKPYVDGDLSKAEGADS